MSSISPTAIKLLNKYTKEEWYTFFDSCLTYKQLPPDLSLNYEFASEYFVEFNSNIANSRDYDLLIKFQNMLVSYYFDLPLLTDNFSRIYTLQWVFSNIKTRVRTSDFYHQLFKEELNNLHYNKIHLHSSLLSLIIQLPNIKNFDATNYLLSSIERVNDLSFFRVSLRYFIKKNSIVEYLNYFNKISYKYSELSKVLVESIMDLRDFYGSFEQFYFYFQRFWDDYKMTYPQISDKVVEILNTKYLTEGKKWYDNDLYAIMLKLYINSSENAPPVTLVSSVFHQANDLNYEKRSNVIKSLEAVFKNKSRWSTAIVVDVHTSNYGNSGNLVSIDPYSNKVESFYKNVYGIEKRNSFIINSDEEFESFLTRHCSPDYEYVKKYDIENNKLKAASYAE